MTNGEKIREMDDWELAALITRMKAYPERCSISCPAYGRCPAIGTTCFNEVLAKLKEECSDEDQAKSK